MNSLKLIVAVILLINLSACKKAKKNNDADVAPANPSTIKTEILVDLSANVVYATYSDMQIKAVSLLTSLQTFSASATANNLANAQQAWKNVRSAWEQSEGFLFGPVSVDNIDPRIDTWPIDFARIDSVLNSTAAYTPTYINNLEESLKGFHPIEYMLFGQNGNKTETQFTAREKELLVALADNLSTLCTQVKTSWNPTLTSNYTNEFSTAGNGSAIYQTQRAAYEEMIDAMVGICDEVANGKIAEPLNNNDPTKEESPFAKNSITDFTNNIKSVQNVYLGKYFVDGKGLEDLIKANNLSMDGTIKLKISNALNAMGNVTVSFGDAISQQPIQVQNCITAINDLKSYLENDVKPYVQTLTN